jgi:hypothetical protein
MENEFNPFYRRFNLTYNKEDVKNRFVIRIVNAIHGYFPLLQKQILDDDKQEWVKLSLVNVASALGTEYRWSKIFSDYIQGNFLNCLVSLETLYDTFLHQLEDTVYTRILDNLIKQTISSNEVDIDIEWREGKFWPSGAKLLDNALINENLKWLSDKGYKSVITPFEKGLHNFLEAKNKPERLSDTVTDIYEAVEAMAKIVNNKNDDLSKNAELLIKKLKLSEYYKKMIKDYIKYANDYRHSVKLGEAKNLLTYNEVESFVYISGIFIRLSIQQLD